MPMATFSSMLAQSSQSLVMAQQQIDILQRNASNMSTSGFKEMITTMIPDKSGGVMAAVKLNFGQGDLGAGAVNDAAIKGNALFVTQSSTNERIFTRAGEFSAIQQDNRVFYGIRGRKALGFKIVNGTVSESLVPLDITDSPNVGILEDGTVVSNINSDTPTPLYQLAVAEFHNPEQLDIEDILSYRASRITGEPYKIEAANNPNGSITSTVFGQQRELSNVNPAALNIEMVNINRLLTMVQNTGFKAIDTAYKEAMKILG
ncbi:hypothetical protein CL648_00380 [bacterium]|nr:hypothetical protein [bacterium]